MRFEWLDGERSITLGDYSGGGFAAVNRVGMGSSWRAGVKVGVGVSYQF